MITGTSAANDLLIGSGQIVLGSSWVSRAGLESVVLGGPGEQVAVGALTIRDSACVTLAGATLHASKLTLETAGTLDLRDHELVVQSGKLSDIESWIAAARNAGAWDGTGLTSSAAKARGYTSLAVSLNDLGEGKKLRPSEDFTAILVKHTYDGDVNLDGAVNLNDYFIIDSGYLNKQTGFSNGDVNLDGEINLNDYFLIDSAYLNQIGPLAVTMANSILVSASSNQPTRIPRAKNKTGGRRKVFSTQRVKAGHRGRLQARQPKRSR